MSIIIELSEWEARQASMVGQWRREESRRQGLEDTSQTGMHGDINGAGAEMAYAKYRNVFWSYSVNTFKHEGDVVVEEVRQADEHYKGLLLRPDDRKNDIYVLVTGTLQQNEFVVRGWAYGREVMVSEFYRALRNGRPPCWIMPGDRLRKLSTLPSVRIE